MESMISEALPLTELFGTFFEKITNSHPHKDSLRQELTEFKCVIYTNLHNTSKIDLYLEKLKNMNVIPVSDAVNKDDKANVQMRGGFTSTKSAENSPSMRRASYKNKKAKILTLSSFMKYRTVAQADKQQALSTRYSHVQMLDKDPTNLYRILAILYFTSMFQSPGAVTKLSDIINEVAAKRIPLECPAENLSHEDICGIFCGFFSQLVRMRQARAQITNTLNTFFEMVDEDKVFSISLSCFIKSRLYSFLQQKSLPYELIGYKTYLQSDAFREKIESNAIDASDYVLRIMPFIFEKPVVAQTFENGKITEIVYKTAVSKRQNNEETGKLENEESNAIHLLLEKAFMSLSIFGLFTHNNTPFNTVSDSPQRPRSNTNTIANKETPSRNVNLESSVNTKKTPKVRTLTVDTLFANIPKPNYETRLHPNNIIEVTDREVAQEKAQTEKPNFNELNTKLQKRENLELKLEKELGNNKNGEYRLFPAAGDDGMVSEMTYREPFEKKTAIETEGTGISEDFNSASVERMDMNSNAYRDISAITATNSVSALNKTGLTGIPISTANKTMHTTSGTKMNPPRSAHQRINSYGSYVPIYMNQKEQNKPNSSTQVARKPENLAVKPSHQKTRSSDKPYSALPIKQVQYSIKNDQSPIINLSNLAKNVEAIDKTDNTGNETAKHHENEQANAIDSQGKDSRTSHNLTASNQSKEKLRTLVSKGTPQIPKSSLSVENSPSKHHQRTYSNFEFSGNKYQDLSLNSKSKPSQQAIKLYQPSSNYAKQQQTPLYQPSYTPKANTSWNDSLSRDLSSSPTMSYHRSPISNQSIGYSSNSPSRYSNLGDKNQKSALNGNTSPSFGIQLTSLSTNASFNNFIQAYAKQATIHTQTLV